MSFSDRHGYSKKDPEALRTSLPARVRTRLWNVTRRHYFESPQGMRPSDLGRWDHGVKLLVRKCWDELLGRPRHELDDEMWGPNPHEALEQYFNSCEWHECYGAIEFFAQADSHDGRAVSYMKDCDSVLASEGCPYRFQMEGRCVTPIVDPGQADEVGRALGLPVSSVTDHLRRALKEIAVARSDPAMYRNAIREAVHAVEAAAKHLLGNPKATLGDAIDPLTSKLGAAPALMQALKKLYGWTSGEPGVRHSQVEGSPGSAGAEEAAFMLVTASAAVTYLYARAKAKSISPA